MTVLVTLLILAAAASGILLWILRSGGGLVGRNAELQALSSDAFARLLDESDEFYIRQNLPAGTYRLVRRKRIRAAMDYTSRAWSNAAVLLSLGERARKSPDSATALQGERLVELAIRLRLVSFTALCRFRLALVFPSLPLRGDFVVASYNELCRQAAAVHNQ